MARRERGDGGSIAVSESISRHKKYKTAGTRNTRLNLPSMMTVIKHFSKGVVLNNDLT